MPAFLSGCAVTVALGKTKKPQAHVRVMLTLFTPTSDDDDDDDDHVDDNEGDDHDDDEDGGGADGFITVSNVLACAHVYLYYCHSFSWLEFHSVCECFLASTFHEL